MTIPLSTASPVIDVSELKRIKNYIIGNPSAKAELAQNEAFVQALVNCLTDIELGSPASTSGTNDPRLEASIILSSLSYGSDLALGSLLRSNALHAVVSLLSRSQKSMAPTLKLALTRAMKSIAAAVADVVGPHVWGLAPDWSLLRYQAVETLNFLVEDDSMDAYLPMLLDSSNQIKWLVCQMLGAVPRYPGYRARVSSWIPPEERSLDAQTKRGWEKSSSMAPHSTIRPGGWTISLLCDFISSRDSKLQEAALFALAALAKDEPSIATTLTKYSIEGNVVIMSVLALARARAREVALAACLCATNIIRACPTFSQGDHLAKGLITILKGFFQNEQQSVVSKTYACFILGHLIVDHVDYSRAAFELGILDILVEPVREHLPLQYDAETDEMLAEATFRHIEASLTSIAAMALFDNDIRCSVADDYDIMPRLHTGLQSKDLGVRYSAAQCIRSMSRGVAVLRTSLVDSGLGIKLFYKFKEDGEDRRVMSTVLAVICNMVNDFSPLKQTLLAQGLLPRLMQIWEVEDHELRLNILWAIKNVLRKAHPEMRREVIRHLGWHRIASLFEDPDEHLQEQAYNIIRNIAEDMLGIDMVLQGIDPKRLLDCITSSLSSNNDNVVLQAAYALAHLSNGTEPQKDLIIDHPRVLQAIRRCLAERPNSEIRLPAIACVRELVQNNPKRRKDFELAGVTSALRRICESRGGLPISPGGFGRGAEYHSGAGEDDMHILEEAKEVLGYLEHGAMY